jgi:hypothetical protein
MRPQLQLRWTSQATADLCCRRKVRDSSRARLTSIAYLRRVPRLRRSHLRARSLRRSHLRAQSLRRSHLRAQSLRRSRLPHLSGRRNRSLLLSFRRLQRRDRHRSRRLCRNARCTRPDLDPPCSRILEGHRNQVRTRWPTWQSVVAHASVARSQEWSRQFPLPPPQQSLQSQQLPVLLSADPNHP